jgi:hypothetical protein
MKGQGSYHQQGNVLTMVLVGIIIVLAAMNATAVIIAIMNKQQYTPDPPESSLPQPVSEQAAVDAARNGANAIRKNDASLIAYATAKYYNANEATYPTAFAGGKLTGGAAPQAVQLAYYKQVIVASGTQKPLTSDAVRLVIKAACAATDGATVATATPAYIFVVQYSAQNEKGGFDAKCLAP